VESADPAVCAWVERTLDEYREAAERVTPERFSR
jgi:hypothetical protein